MDGELQLEITEEELRSRWEEHASDVLYWMLSDCLEESWSGIPAAPYSWGDAVNSNVFFSKAIGGGILWESVVEYYKEFQGKDMPYPIPMEDEIFRYIERKILGKSSYSEFENLLLKLNGGYNRKPITADEYYKFLDGFKEVNNEASWTENYSVTQN